MKSVPDLFTRLSALDPGSAGALRIIECFDALTEHGANVEMVLRESAALANCAVGVRTEDGHLSERAEPGGRISPGGPSAGAQRYRLPFGDEVWLERGGQDGQLDSLLIKRFAIAAAAALGRGTGEPSVSALLELALRPGAAAQRARALDHLGIASASTVHMVAMKGEPRYLAEISGRFATGKRAKIGAIEALLVTDPVPDDMGVPLGCGVGVATPHPALELPEAWEEARTALRFTLPSTRASPPYMLYMAPLVRYAGLGGFAAIAETITVDRINRVPDVVALDQLARERGGEEMLRTLEAVAATESLRHAAKLLHLHHDSVANRVARAAQALGYAVTEPYARPKLMLALALQRVRASTLLF